MHGYISNPRSKILETRISRWQFGAEEFGAEEFGAEEFGAEADLYTRRIHWTKFILLAFYRPI